MSPIEGLPVETEGRSMEASWEDSISMWERLSSGCRKYLRAEKPVLESLGVKILLVKDNKEVGAL